MADANRKPAPQSEVNDAFAASLRFRCNADLAVLFDL
jgi:hypothetical protein